MLETQEKRIYLDHFIHGRNIKALTCSARRPYPPQILLKSTKTWFYYMRYITDICFVFIHWEVILRFPALLPETPQPPFEAWQSRAGWRRRAGEGSPAPSDSTRRTESARAKGWCWSTVHPSGLRSRRAELYSPLSTTRHPRPLRSLPAALPNHYWSTLQAWGPAVPLLLSASWLPTTAEAKILQINTPQHKNLPP